MRLSLPLAQRSLPMVLVLALAAPLAAAGKGDSQKPGPKAPSGLELPAADSEAAAVADALLKKAPDSATNVAEGLLEIAQNNRLGDHLATVAGRLLEHGDPIVRGMAEWAIAMKIGGENNGQKAAWPKAELPAWYTAWSTLSARERLEADWVRQAVASGIHREPARLLESIDAMIRRGEASADAFSRAGLSADEAAMVRGRIAEMRAIRAQLADMIPGDPKERAARHRLWIEARRKLREVALVNPAIDFDELLLVTGFTPHTVRNITRSYPWKHKPGGSILVLGMNKEVLASDDKAVARDVLAGQLGPGHVRGIDLDWDAGRLVFGYARQPVWPPEVNTADAYTEGLHAYKLRKIHEPIHLFEIGSDGSDPRQLTDHDHWSDFEPTYAPGGEVVFVSERGGRSPECGSFEHDHAAVNLFRLSADRRRIEHLTDSKDYDRYPHCLDNGQIAYTHWEYQERHFMEVHSIWTIRPDGAMADALFKHHMPAPLALRDTRSIPGSSKLVSIATGHHTFAFGPLVVVDPRGGLNRKEGIEIVTPGVVPQEGPMAGRVAAEGGVADRGGLYQTPWALSEDAFLAAYSYARPKCTASGGADSNGFGLYYVDVFGNKELIYRDPLLSCSFPIPLKPRPRPPVTPERRDPLASDAVCYVTDVYDGMPEVPRGTIKYLRISQHVGWPLDAQRGAMPYLPSNAYQSRFGQTNWSPVRVLGTVRVEADGSAQFRVPANTAVYFQALDERQMEVRRMRSMASFAPGEVRGCRGCHESESKAPVLPHGRPMPLAMAQAPQTPKAPQWGAQRLLGYEWLVQPVLERHCVRCHRPGESAEKIDLTAGRAADGYLQSFRTLLGVPPGATKPGRTLVATADRFSNSSVTKPMQFGSHCSPAVQVLLKDELHRTEVKLDDDDWVALVTWIDANAPYFDRFFDKRPSDGAKPDRRIDPAQFTAIPSQ